VLDYFIGVLILGLFMSLIYFFVEKVRNREYIVFSIIYSMLSLFGIVVLLYYGIVAALIWCYYTSISFIILLYKKENK